jgi:hypothetical protein
MKNIHLHPSIYLAWNIANIEACYSRSQRIDPIHFLLATLIIIDGVFEEVADAMNLPPEAIRSVFDAASKCRAILQMSDDEITNSRRSIRRTLREGGETNELVTLHRSGEARFIFQRAGRRTISAGEDQLTIVHLLEELLEHMPREAGGFIKNFRPSPQKQTDEWPDYIVDDTRL